MIIITKKSGNISLINENAIMKCDYNVEDLQVCIKPLNEPSIVMESVVSVECIGNLTNPITFLSAYVKPIERQDSANLLLESIYSLESAIEAMDAEDTRERGGKAQKAGSFCRFIDVCKANHISTIQDLLNVGKENFTALHNMGPLCVKQVSLALKTLYNIEQW